MEQETKILTPLEKLRQDKDRVKSECREVEKRLNENYLYMQDHTASIVFSGISTLLFPGSHSAKKENKADDGMLLPVVSAGLSLSDYLSIGKSALPYVWNIVRPVLFTWGIGKTQSVLFRLLFGKKKGKK